MSLKTIENVVRELQLTVVSLVNKIESLECKISEQSEIITKLTPSANTSTRKSLSSAVTQAAAAPQRPIRTARIQASAAIAEIQTAANKRRNGGVSTAIPTKNDVVPTTNQSEKRSNSKETSRINDSPNGFSTTKTLTTVPPVALEDTKNTADKTENDWQVISRQRRHKQRPAVIVGTANSTHDLQAADRVRYIQAWSFRPDTTSESVHSFLNKITKSDYTVEKRNIKSDKHASFVIGMPENVYTEVTTPTAWPSGIRFSEWFLFRPRSPRGCERTD